MYTHAAVAKTGQRRVCIDPAAPYSPVRHHRAGFFFWLSYTAPVFDNPDHAGFLIFAFIVAVIAVALMLVAAQWLLNRGFGPGAVAGRSSTSGIFRAAPLDAGYFYLLARHSVDLRWRIEFESSNLQDIHNKYNACREHDKAYVELKIVSAHDAHLATITSVLAELNEGS
jgi:hypothetical protein